MHQVETVSAAPASLGSSDQDNATQQAPSLNIVVEFSYCANFLHHELGKRGGLEMLFADRRRLQLTVPKSDDRGKPLTIAALIDHLCQHEMNDGRKDLFVLDGHLRPGILVLINDADWELEGEEAYEVQSGDNVLLIFGSLDGCLPRAISARSSCFASPTIPRPLWILGLGGQAAVASISTVTGDDKQGPKIITSPYNALDAPATQSGQANPVPDLKGGCESGMANKGRSLAQDPAP
ncbi:hypothetical protein OOU_Y34scaffold00514g26 [Pyricularia oryzae Y34]|uniref:Ubiquitin-related modifier 1 n=2 Tax=Pyricularia oryzae TaxID=318829 RepID=A0AA97PLP0_PYRO3|nr:hypothetical protein OOU_Y34scaffold00514g26 [Pyricularia oryzae Y34]